MPAARSRDRSRVRDSQPKPRSDAYTGLLLLALLAQVAGIAFLVLDWSRYPASTPDKPPTLAASPAAGPGTPAPPPNPNPNPNPPGPPGPPGPPPKGP